MSANNNIVKLDKNLIDKRLKKIKNSYVKHKKNNIRPQFKKIDGMTGKIKVFDQKLSDMYDTKARRIIKERLGPSIVDNPDPYGEDMVVLTDEIPYGYIELQVYGKWTGKYFPYSAPFVYERKMKFNKSTLFICFNADYTKVIMFSRTVIHPIKQRAKKYSREYVHYIPFNKALTVDIDELSLDTILLYCNPAKYFEKLENSETSPQTKDLKHSNDPKHSNDSNDPKHSNDSNDSNNPKHSNDSNNPKHSNDSKDLKDSNNRNQTCDRDSDSEDWTVIVKK